MAVQGGVQSGGEAVERVQLILFASKDTKVVAFQKHAHPINVILLITGVRFIQV